MTTQKTIVNKAIDLFVILNFYNKKKYTVNS